MHIHTQSTGMAKFGTSVQTRDVQGFQTLDSLKLEPRLDPKSTKDNHSLFTVSKHHVSM